MTDTDSGARIPDPIGHLSWNRTSRVVGSDPGVEAPDPGRSPADTRRDGPAEVDHADRSDGGDAC